MRRWEKFAVPSRQNNKIGICNLSSNIMLFPNFQPYRVGMPFVMDVVLLSNICAQWGCINLLNELFVMNVSFATKIKHFRIN